MVVDELNDIGRIFRVGRRRNTNRLVEGHVNTLSFGTYPLAVDYNLIHIVDTLPQCCTFAVDLDASLLNKTIGLPP